MIWTYEFPQNVAKVPPCYCNQFISLYLKWFWSKMIQTVLTLSAFFPVLFGKKWWISTEFAKKRKDPLFSYWRQFSYILIISRSPCKLCMTSSFSFKEKIFHCPTDADFHVFSLFLYHRFPFNLCMMSSSFSFQEKIFHFSTIRH